MRAVDANILLRYLLGDDPEQSPKATRLMESGELLGLTAVALAEAAWTMTRPHRGLGRAWVAAALIALLESDTVIAVGFDKAQARDALLDCARPVGAADFGDALIAGAAPHRAAPSPWAGHGRIGAACARSPRRSRRGRAGTRPYDRRSGILRSGRMLGPVRPRQRPGRPACHDW